MESLQLLCPTVPSSPKNLPSCRHHQIILMSSASCSRNTHAYRTSLCSFFPKIACSPESSRRYRSKMRIVSSYISSGRDGEDGEGEGDLERALNLDGSIPGTSDQFVKKVSSRAYDMRRNLQQSFDSSSYDVLEVNPWQEDEKPVYVLTQRENQLCTMKTRRNQSEVESELGKLFSKGRNWGSNMTNKTQQLKSGGPEFRMLVEDVREGVLVFEDEKDAARYCDLLQGGGQGCEGVAEVDASSVFDICRKMRALAVIFRRGRTPPVPKSLELNLKAKKRSLEDQEDLI